MAQDKGETVLAEVARQRAEQLDTESLATGEKCFLNFCPQPFHSCSDLHPMTTPVRISTGVVGSKDVVGSAQSISSHLSLV